MLDHTEYQRILRKLKESKGIENPWKGFLYRSSAMEYANKADFMSGEGSFKNGGRYNAVGSFKAVYGSLSDHTALEEAKAHAVYYNFPGHTVFPLVLAALDVSLQKILDLTSRETRDRIRIAKNIILDCDWRSEQDKGREAATQAVGRAAFVAGFEGILVPSAADRRGKCLVFFPEKLLKGSNISYVNKNKIMRIPRKP